MTDTPFEDLVAGVLASETLILPPSRVRISVLSNRGGPGWALTAIDQNAARACTILGSYSDLTAALEARDKLMPHLSAMRRLST